MVAAIRRSLSPEGRILNTLTLLASLLLLAGAIAFILGECGSTCKRALLLGLLAVLILVSTRFSARLMRWLLVAAIVMLVIGIIRLGRETMGEDRAESGRQRATEFDVLLRAAVAGGGDERTPATGAPRVPEAAIGDLERLLAAAPQDPTTAALRAVPGRLRELLAGPTPDAALDAVSRTITALDPDQLQKQAADAVAAVRLSFRVAPAQPSPASAQAATARLCEAAGGQLKPDPEKPDPEKPDPEIPEICSLADGHRVSPDRIADRTAEADLEITRYQLARATGDEARKSLTADVTEKEAAYATSVGSRTAGPDAIEVLDALRLGAEEVVAAVFGADDDPGTDVPVGLGLFGWISLGAILLLGYRALERRAAAKALGPVTVEGKDPATVERFRTYVLRNIPDPGAMPGASALLPVTDLLGATKAPAAGVVAKVIAAVASALDQKKGYVVTFGAPDEGAKAEKKITTATTDSEGGAAKEPKPADEGKPAPKDPGKSAGAVVSVRVNHARTGALIDQKLVRDDASDEAIREAAYWAAAVVLSRSDRVPHWARWPIDTSASLATYFAADDKGTPERLEDIVKALSGAPRSGLLCLQLSNEYALHGRHLDAFELALRAAAVNGRYLAARYRLAMTASLVASDVDEHWRACPPQQRQRVLAAAERYPHTKTSALRSELANSDNPAIRRALCAFALKEIDSVDGLLRPRRLLTSALRRSERSYWLAFLRSDEEGLTARKQFRRVVTSARPAIEWRGTETAKDRDPMLNDPLAFWQVAYNLACYEAIRSRPGSTERALCSLEMARERPGSHQLKRSWVEKDPDLAGLRESSRFKDFVSSLNDDRRDDAVEA